MAFEDADFLKVFSSDILESYIVNKRWYGGKASTLKYIEVVDYSGGAWESRIAHTTESGDFLSSFPFDRNIKGFGYIPGSDSLLGIRYDVSDRSDSKVVEFGVDGHNDSIF